MNTPRGKRKHKGEKWDIEKDEINTQEELLGSLEGNLIEKSPPDNRLQSAHHQLWSENENFKGIRSLSNFVLCIKIRH